MAWLERRAWALGCLVGLVVVAACVGGMAQREKQIDQIVQECRAEHEYNYCPRAPGWYGINPMPEVIMLLGLFFGGAVAILSMGNSGVLEEDSPQ